MPLPKELLDNSWIPSKEGTEEDRVVLVKDVGDWFKKRAGKRTCVKCGFQIARRHKYKKMEKTISIGIARIPFIILMII